MPMIIGHFVQGSGLDVQQGVADRQVPGAVDGESASDVGADVAQGSVEIDEVAAKRVQLERGRLHGRNGARTGFHIDGEA